jgi:hypothetical protein
MGTRYKALLLLEVFVCFGPVTFLWGLGAFVVGALVPAIVSNPLAVDAFLYAFLVLPVVCGFCGLTSMIYVLRKVLGDGARIHRPGLVLAGAVLGGVAALTFWPLGLAAIASAAHVIFLARKILFGGNAAHTARRAMDARRAVKEAPVTSGDLSSRSQLADYTLSVTRDETSC